MAPLIVTEQHGFLPKKSCESNLLECIYVISEFISKDQRKYLQIYCILTFKRPLILEITGKTPAIVKDFSSWEELSVSGTTGRRNGCFHSISVIGNAKYFTLDRKILDMSSLKRIREFTQMKS